MFHKKRREEPKKDDWKILINKLNLNIIWITIWNWNWKNDDQQIEIYHIVWCMITWIDLNQWTLSTDKIAYNIHKTKLNVDFWISFKYLYLIICRWKNVFPLFSNVFMSLSQFHVEFSDNLIGDGISIAHNINCLLLVACYSLVNVHPYFSLNVAHLKSPI